MSIRFVGLLRQNSRPGFLRVVQHEGNKLHQGFFRLIACRGSARRVRIAYPGRSGRSRSTAAIEKREEVCLEDEAEDEQDDGAADADVHAAKLKPAATASGFVATIFNVRTIAAGSPLHGSSPSTGLENSITQRG